MGDGYVQLLRTLADVGAAPPQLELLHATAGGDDAAPARKLALLADEVAWPLRALGRLARRRWRLRDDEAFPDALQGLLDDADAAAAAPAPG